MIGTGAGVYVLPASLIAGAGEEGAEFRDVEDVDIPVRRVRGDVLAGGRGRHGDAKVVGHLRDVEDVGVAVVIEVGGLGVGAAVREWICACRVLKR